VRLCQGVARGGEGPRDVGDGLRRQVARAGGGHGREGRVERGRRVPRGRVRPSEVGDGLTRALARAGRRRLGQRVKHRGRRVAGGGEGPRRHRHVGHAERGRAPRDLLAERLEERARREAYLCARPSEVGELARLEGREARRRLGGESGKQAPLRAPSRSRSCKGPRQVGEALRRKLGEPRRRLVGDRLEEGRRRPPGRRKRPRHHRDALRGELLQPPGRQLRRTRVKERGRLGARRSKGPEQLPERKGGEVGQPRLGGGGEAVKERRLRPPRRRERPRRVGKALAVEVAGTGGRGGAEFGPERLVGSALESELGGSVRRRRDAPGTPVVERRRRLPGQRREERGVLQQPPPVGVLGDPAKPRPARGEVDVIERVTVRSVQLQNAVHRRCVCDAAIELPWRQRPRCAQDEGLPTETSPPAPVVPTRARQRVGQG